MQRRAFLKRVLGGVVAAVCRVPFPCAGPVYPDPQGLQRYAALMSMEATTVKWTEQGGMTLTFKVMALLVPELRKVQ